MPPDLFLDVQGPLESGRRVILAADPDCPWPRAPSRHQNLRVSPWCTPHLLSFIHAPASSAPTSGGETEVGRDYVACPRSHTGMCPDPKPTPFLPQEKGQMVRPCPSSLPVCSPDGAEAAWPAVPGGPGLRPSSSLLPRVNFAGSLKASGSYSGWNETQPGRLTVASWVFHRSAVAFGRQSPHCQASPHLGKWTSIRGRTGAYLVPPQVSGIMLICKSPGT